MRLRPRRRNLIGSGAAVPPGRFFAPRSTRPTAAMQIRWWLRVLLIIALLAAVGGVRRARTTRIRWRAGFLLAGAMLTIVSATVLSGAAQGLTSFLGVLVFLFALLLSRPAS
jgi:hypothetical protein